MPNSLGTGGITLNQKLTLWLLEVLNREMTCSGICFTRGLLTAVQTSPAEGHGLCQGDQLRGDCNSPNKNGWGLGQHGNRGEKLDSR